MPSLLSSVRLERNIRKVQAAYEHPGGPVHQELMARFDRWMQGGERGFASRRRRKDIHYILKAARQIAREGKGGRLGVFPFGFDDLKIECFSSDSNTSFIYLFGRSDNLPFFEIYRRLVRPGSTCADVGANIGMHTLVMAHLTGEQGQVLSFEPSPGIARRLATNIELNGLKQVRLINAGCGSEPGTLNFDDQSDATNIGKSRISDSGAIQVPVTTLDQELADARDVCLIKIDVEGFELEVLKGAEETLRRHRPVLLLEYNRADYSWQRLCEQIPFEFRSQLIPSTLGSDPVTITPQEIASGSKRQLNLVLTPL